MGKKVEIKYIENKQKRMVCFAKRRMGLFKKVRELSELSGTHMAVITFSGKGKPFCYGHPSSPDDLIRSFLLHMNQRDQRQLPPTPIDTNPRETPQLLLTSSAEPPPLPLPLLPPPSPPPPSPPPTTTTMEAAAVSEERLWRGLPDRDYGCVGGESELRHPIMASAGAQPSLVGPPPHFGVEYGNKYYYYNNNNNNNNNSHNNYYNYNNGGGGGAAEWEEIPTMGGSTALNGDLEPLSESEMANLNDFINSYLF